MAKGTLFAVSGHSGSGKTSIMRAIMGVEKEIVSVTTRPMRNGEVDGVDYYFISQDSFDILDISGGLAEKTTYYGRASYGVTKVEIESKLAKGDAYIIVDFNGFQQLKKIYPDVVGIFMYTDIDVAEKRMEKRGDNLGSIESRLTTYDIELSNMKHYDYHIKNDDYNKTCEYINDIVNKVYHNNVLQFEREYNAEWVKPSEE